MNMDRKGMRDPVAYAKESESRGDLPDMRVCSDGRRTRTVSYWNPPGARNSGQPPARLPEFSTRALIQEKLCHLSLEQGRSTELLWLGLRTNIGVTVESTRYLEGRQHIYGKTK
uniref:Uncharacterized protein n=1 Tax=Haemonchus contortus TaxID=6289 RepID=A0A7I4Y2H2_HAECO